MTNEEYSAKLSEALEQAESLLIDDKEAQRKATWVMNHRAKDVIPSEYELPFQIYLAGVAGNAPTLKRSAQALYDAAYTLKNDEPPIAGFDTICDPCIDSSLANYTPHPVTVTHGLNGYPAGLVKS